MCVPAKERRLLGGSKKYESTENWFLPSLLLPYLGIFCQGQGIYLLCPAPGSFLPLQTPPPLYSVTLLTSSEARGEDLNRTLKGPKPLENHKSSQPD